MGVAASVADQKSLYATLHRQHGVAYNKDSARIDIESSEEFGTDDECVTKAEKGSVDPFFATANQTYADWHRLMKLKEQTVFCELTDFEDALEAAFRTGRTPLILDTSPDDKVCTFFSYQPDVILLDAKAMILAASAGTSSRNKVKSGKKTTTEMPGLPAGSSLSIEEKLMALDTARKALVNSMKFGKLLVIRLGTSTPDFLHVFCDQALGIDTSKAGSAYFPLEVFYEAGRRLHDEDALARSDDVSRKVPKDSAKHTQNAQSSAKSSTVAGIVVDNTRIITEAAEEERAAAALSMSASAPDVSATTVTSTVKAPTWAERLYREEDMKPHKNFALCRKEFRVCVISQLPLENIQEYLFGHIAAPAELSSASETTSKNTGGAPNPHTLIQISSNAGTGANMGVVGGAGSVPGGVQSQVSVRAMLPALEHFKVVSIVQDPVVPAEE